MLLSLHTTTTTPKFLPLGITVKMSTAAENPTSSCGVDSGRLRRHRHRSSETTTDTDSDQWPPSPAWSATDCLSEDVDLESGELELKVHSAKEERECRICHLNLVVGGGGGGGGGGNEELGVGIELGCCCKGDLGAAHKQCAETWFKIRGNTTCEICGDTARNVIGEQIREPNGAAAAAPVGPAIVAETRGFQHGCRRVMKFLFACVVSALVIYWLVHFNVITISYKK